MPLDGGAARVGDLDVAKQTLKARRLLGYIPEQVNLYDNLTGRENLSYFSELAGERHSPSQLASLLQRAGLPPAAVDRRVGAYSKGMRQKVGVAIALAKRARVLLLDEPTSGLDPKAAHEFSRTLVDLAGDGVAVLMATHDLFRAREVARRVGILREGRLVQELETSGVSHTDLERIYLEQVDVAPLEVAPDVAVAVESRALPGGVS
ncbi:MAG: ABC transporter ATP-binding protein [Thermoanaerobaculia bacterium]